MSLPAGEDPRDFDEQGVFSLDLYRARQKADIQAKALQVDPPEVIQAEHSVPAPPPAPGTITLDPIPVEANVPHKEARTEAVKRALGTEGEGTQ